MPEVYGEDTYKVDISKGLWVGGSITARTIIYTNAVVMAGLQQRVYEAPDGYCTSILNMVKNNRGNWVPRRPFQLKEVNTTGKALVANTFSPTAYAGFEAYCVGDETKMAYPLPAYKGSTPAVILTGSRTLINYRALSGVGGGTANFNSITYNATAQTYQPRTYTLYKDRMYACNAAGSWYRITGWGTFTAANVALTETLLPGANNSGMAGVTGIFAFKDRLFAYKDNRVWFTDVATAGGYPEAWDSTVNFFDIPSSGSPAIWNAIIIQNLVYLFTEDGVYTLQVYGTPDLWVIRKLREDIIVYHHFASCVNNGVIYFVNNESVYAFNGSKVVDIGAPLKNLFGANNFPVLMGVAPFQEGVTLTIQLTTSDATEQYVNWAETFYFDGEVWTQFTIPDTTDSNTAMVGHARVFSISNSFNVNLFAPGTNLAGNMTFINATIGGISGTKLSCSDAVIFYNDRAGLNKDALTISSSTHQFNGHYACQLATNILVPNPGKYTYFKLFQLDIYSAASTSFAFDYISSAKIPSNASGTFVTIPGNPTPALNVMRLAGCDASIGAMLTMWIKPGQDAFAGLGGTANPADGFEILAMRALINADRTTTELVN